MRRTSLAGYLTAIIGAFFVFEALSRKNPETPIRDREGATESVSEKAQKALAAQPKQEQWHPEEREHRATERNYWERSFYLSLATLIVTILAATFAGGAFVVSRNSLIEARKATGEAHRQADEAMRQADIAQQAFVEADRPIIDILATNLDFTGDAHNGKPTIDFTINNIGQKPGFIWLAIAQITLTDAEAPKNDAFDLANECIIVLGPQTVNVGMGLQTTCSRHSPLTIEEKKRLLENTMQAYFHGVIKYKSSSGNFWVKGFDYYWAAPYQNRPSYLREDLDPSKNFDRLIPPEQEQKR